MQRTDLAAAVNARLVPVVEYAPDTRGWSMFARLAGIHQRSIAGREQPAVIERWGTYDGPVQSPQRMTGLDGIAAGRQRPLVERSSQLDKERSTSITDPALRLFAERQARGQR
jgi:hypothetical protein